MWQARWRQSPPHAAGPCRPRRGVESLKTCRGSSGASYNRTAWPACMLRRLVSIGSDPPTDSSSDGVRAIDFYVLSVLKPIHLVQFCKIAATLFSFATSFLSSVACLGSSCSKVVSLRLSSFMPNPYSPVKFLHQTSTYTRNAVRRRCPTCGSINVEYFNLKLAHGW